MNVHTQACTHTHTHTKNIPLYTHNIKFMSFEMPLPLWTMVKNNK